MSLGRMKIPKLKPRLTSTTTLEETTHDGFLSTNANVDYKRLHEELEYKRTHVHELAQISMKRQTLPVFKYKKKSPREERESSRPSTPVQPMQHLHKYHSFCLTIVGRMVNRRKIICTQPRRISAMTVSRSHCERTRREYRRRNCSIKFTRIENFESVWFVTGYDRRSC